MTNRLSEAKRAKRRFSLQGALVLFCVFLAALNFAGRHYYCIFLAFGLLLLLCKWAICKNVEMVCLLVFSLSLLIFSPTCRGGLTSMLKAFTYLLSYIIGYSVIRESRTDGTVRTTEAAVERGIMAAAAGTFLHLLLNYGTNYGSTLRNTADFWTGATLSATGQAALGCLPVGVACGVIFSGRKVLHKVLAVVVLALIFGYNLILAGRTLVALILVTALLAGVYALIGGGGRKERKRILGFALVMALILLVLYRSNSFGIRDMVENSNLYERFFGQNGAELLSDNRFKYKLLYLDRFFEHLFGGNHIFNETGKYAHDLFLDTYDEAGIFAFLAISVYVVKTVFNLLAVLRSSVCSFGFKQMVLCTYSVFYIQFMIEPILAGEPLLLALFCLIDGMLVNVVTQISMPRTDEGVTNANCRD